MTAYYNEFDPAAAAWLRELIKAGEIAPGDVDTRSIEDVRPSDLRGYTQCHFFAGIGGWSLALRMAGWSDDRPVWTGSCPCQPFSAAGKGAGFADERHLWPAFHWLIEQCRPPVIFGEQVASRDGLNWLDLVCADLEGAAYAVGATDLCAAGVGAPHIRQRLYWVADSRSSRSLSRAQPRLHRSQEGSGTRDVKPKRYGAACGVADDQLQQRPNRNSRIGLEDDAQGRKQGPAAVTGFCSDMPADPLHGFWSGADWLGCRDGKLRPVEPGSFPLAHGVSARVAALRGYGNAIVPAAAAAFVRAAA
ncbi:DNA cytosine methyltransferase [Xanthomonas campestris]|uniref:DNA cytosine methyltransferase n=1 Tax=Xanthomonas campestris TaxID=339 RepID=UPI0009BB9261|nr:DNA cytosine methyltransferase [Xanthomonas campestris]